MCLYERKSEREIIINIFEIYLPSSKKLLDYVKYITKEKTITILKKKFQVVHIINFVILESSANRLATKFRTIVYILE